MSTPEGPDPSSPRPRPAVIGDANASGRSPELSADPDRPGSLAAFGPGEGPDLAAEMRLAAASLTKAPKAGPSAGRGSTSDLSIDEGLLLHSIGWEPVDLVCGVSLVSVPMGVWNWGSGEIAAASQAQTDAARHAAAELTKECDAVGGHGVVGVEVEIVAHPHHIEVSLLGTAVRPVGGKSSHRLAFVSDLSARDFVLLHAAGWNVVGFAFGTSFVYAPRRSVGMALRQSTQNVELTNLTEAMYFAREAAMERMQSSATAIDAGGVVAVQVREGPVHFARHAIEFTAWGTAVAVGEGGHQYLKPQMVVPLDDAILAFDARSLRG